MSALAHSAPDRLTDPLIQTWVELRFAQAPLTAAAIVLAVRQRTGADLRQIMGAVDGWVRAGLVTVDQATYAMTDIARRRSSPPPVDHRSAPPRHWTQRRPARQRLWTAARILRSFDIVTLRRSADVVEARARDFIRIFERAGYLRRGLTATGQLHWTWARGVGPQAPVVRRVVEHDRTIQRVVDRNDGGIIDIVTRPHRPDRTPATGPMEREVNHVC